MYEYKMLLTTNYVEVINLKFQKGINFNNESEKTCSLNFSSNFL